MKALCNASVIAAVLLLFTASVHADPNELVRQVLVAGGQWSVTADDNASKETLDSGLIRRMVAAYRSNPADPDALFGMGLLALTVGVAEWGVAPSESLPADPAGLAWKSVAGPHTGKHLMSYSEGGIGISHVDGDEMLDFIRHVADSETVPAAFKAPLLHLADPRLYRKGKNLGYYDQLRAAGVCSTQETSTDLLGEPFRLGRLQADKEYCSHYRNTALTFDDWRAFCTWMRAALRQEHEQTWLIEKWVVRYWKPSLSEQFVPPGEGAIEEALVNVRVRNSSPAIANKAHEREASTTDGRVQRQLDAYGAFKFSTLQRRCGLMLRPVALYRHFTDQSQVHAKCPKKA